MTDEEIRIAIAEACGLLHLMPLKRTTRRMKDDPNGVRLWYCDHHHGGAAEYIEVPFYPTDLNAMHGAFGSMNPWMQPEFSKNLLSVYRSKTGTERTGAAVVDLLHADARHWAEAFLRTLNLWKD
jgi:hypothetical protein